jgi:hypothetical protein
MNAFMNPVSVQVFEQARVRGYLVIFPAGRSDLPHQDLDARLHTTSNHRFDMDNQDIEAQLERTARSALFLQRTGLPVPLDHPARSYFGGLPKLPEHLAWPTLEIEPVELDLEEEIPSVEELEDFSHALFFAAQIDLSELPQTSTNPLPHTGTLYFFFDTSNEAPDGHETRVLYYEGSAHELPERKPPSNLWRYGGGDEPWPWLADDEPTARLGFKYPIRSIPFTSYCDHLDPSAKYSAEKLQSAEFDAKLPLRTGGGSHEDATGQTWPFAWPVIEHLARAVCKEVADASRFRTPSPEVAAQMQAMTACAEQWLQRAKLHQGTLECDASTREWFKQEWSWIQDAAKRVNKHQQCHLSLYSAAAAATYLTCFSLASESHDAAALIPDRLAQWLEDASKREPLLQRLVSARPVHQMLGYGSSVQSAPLEHANDVLLLQIAGEEGFAWFPDIGCVLQFWIAPDALAERNFEHVTISLDCS